MTTRFEHWAVPSWSLIYYAGRFILITYFMQILYGEGPANPTMSILDLEAFGALGKSLPGVVTTFGSLYLIQPIKLGLDLVIHSW